MKWAIGWGKKQNIVYREPVAQLMEMMEMMKRTRVLERHIAADMFRHVRRRFNSCADAPAGREMDLATMHVPPLWSRYWHVHTDGGAGAEGGGIGWHLDGVDDLGPSPAHWRRLADVSWVLPAEARAMEAELMAVVSAVSLVCRAWSMGALKVVARPRVWNLRLTTGARGGGRERERAGDVRQQSARSHCKR